MRRYRSVVAVFEVGGPLKLLCMFQSAVQQLVSADCILPSVSSHHGTAVILPPRSAHTPILLVDQYRPHETQLMENVFPDCLRYIPSTSAFS